MLLIKDIKIHGVKFDLKKAEERAHILIGLATAVENKDEIIKIIKNSKDAESAINGKFRLHFKWPLYLHGLYYQEILKTN
jgi:DNA gyrase subunit A